MANLVSPGVAVSVVDESAYGAGSQGTVPLLVLATASNKSNTSGSGYAAGTLPANAGKAYLLTSQRDLVEQFGAPSFEVVDGTPVHASELNEYGLMAAYSFLGLANRAYVLRADVDLAQLQPSSTEPTSAPSNGTYWLDLTTSVWGVKEFDGSAWVSKSVLLPTATEVDSNKIPLSSFGANGDYAVSLYSGGTYAINALFKKSSGSWAAVEDNAGVLEVYVAPHYKLGTDVPSTPMTGSVWIQTTSPNNGLNLVVKKYSTASSQWTNIAVPGYTSDVQAGTPAVGSLYAKIDPDHVAFELKIYTSTGWQSLASANSYEASLTAPVGEAATGTLWYNTNLFVDLYVKASGAWMPVTAAVTVDAVEPSSAMAGDIWVDSSDLENYPAIYQFNGSSWVSRDTADQTTPNGVIFADLTATAGDSSNGGGATAVDEEAPDPEFYPEGMLLWNSMVSTGNVKQYDAATGLWNTVSGLKADGSPYMLRKAQRKVVVTAMQAAINANTAIREETTYFSLLAAPGYPELLDEMVALNTDRKETAFIIVDTPMRLAPTGTDLVNWATGVNATVNGEEGLVTGTSQAAAYYPSAVTSDLSGNDVVVPASHVVLRTMAYNDQVAYPWFAPAGLTRGVVTNAAGVGYVSSEGEFIAVALTNGQRDTLYANRINPIANFPGQGLYVFGQKTLQGFASALDRVNVSRLLAYLRERFDVIARPFIFEPNDKITRTNAKAAFDAFMSDMMAKRAVYDFIVVCDETNNTPARIDKNELWIDVAIEPVKAGEFIYIPIRVVNTGDLSSAA